MKPNMVPITRLELAQWRERVTPVRRSLLSALFWVLLCALMFGFTFDLYVKFAMESGGTTVPVTKLLNIAVFVSLMGVLPFFAAQQIGSPTQPWVTLLCGICMICLPRLFLPDQVPYGVMTTAVTGVVVCSLILIAVYLATKAPRFSIA